MDFQTLHFLKLYVRHHKQVWHVTSGPTFSLDHEVLSKVIVGCSRSTLFHAKGGVHDHDG